MTSNNKDQKEQEWKPQRPKSAPVPASKEPAEPEATITKVEPRRKTAGKPQVRQELKGPKIGRGTRITKPTFGNVTSTIY